MVPTTSKSYTDMHPTSPVKEQTKTLMKRRFIRYLGFQYRVASWQANKVANKTLYLLQRLFFFRARIPACQAYRVQAKLEVPVDSIYDDGCLLLINAVNDALRSASNTIGADNKGTEGDMCPGGSKSRQIEQYIAKGSFLRRISESTTLNAI